MPLDGATTFYLTQGVLGVTVLVLGTVIYLQDKRYRADVKEKDTMITALQEKRTVETGAYTDKFITVSQTLLNQLKDILNIELSNQKAIETIASILQKRYK